MAVYWDLRNNSKYFWKRPKYVKSFHVITRKSYRKSNVRRKLITLWIFNAMLWIETMALKGSDHLAHSWGGLGRFLGSHWDRQLKFSVYASFLISWSLSKFELMYLDNSFFIVSKGGTKGKRLKNQCKFSTFFLWKLSMKKKLSK